MKEDREDPEAEPEEQEPEEPLEGWQLDMNSHSDDRGLELIEEARQIALEENPQFYFIDFDDYIRTPKGALEFRRLLTEYYRRAGTPIYWGEDGPFIPGVDDEDS